MTKTLENACVSKVSVVAGVTAVHQGSGVTHSSRAAAAIRRDPHPATVMPRVSVGVCKGSRAGRVASAVPATSASLTVCHVTVTRREVLGYPAAARVNASVRTTTVALIVISAVKDSTTFLSVKVSCAN